MKNKLTVSLFWFLLVAVLVVSARHGLRYFIDYPMYERAGTKVLAGDVSDLYERDRKEPPKFHYSYFFAFLFSFFTWIGPTLGRPLYTLFYASLYGFVLWTSTRLALASFTDEQRQRHFYPVALGTLLLSIYTLNDAFMTSNIALPLLALSLGSYQLSQRHPWGAGLLLGSAITIKIFFLLVLCYFVWARAWQVVAWTVFFILVFYVLLPGVMVGFPTALSLIQTQSVALREFGDHWPLSKIWFQNVTGTLLRYSSLFGMENPKLASLALVVSCLALLAFFWRTFTSGASQQTRALRLPAFVLVLAATPLLLPISWYNVGLYYVPLTAALWTRWLCQRERAALFGLTAFATLYCLTTPDLWGTPMNDIFEFYSIPFLGAVLMVGSHVFMWWKAFMKPERLGNAVPPRPDGWSVPSLLGSLLRKSSLER